jgi:hypothetical protein
MRLSCSLPIGQVVGNGERVPLTGLLRFDPADPIAITLVIRVTTGQTVEWTFARNLLAADTDQPVGVGEVRVRPSQHGQRRVLAMTLTGPDGRTELELPSRRVDVFVRQTYLAVPAEREADLIDWSSEFASLLGSEEPAKDRSTDT